MFSIQRFLGRDHKFYNLLEASAEQADASVHHLVALLGKVEHYDSPESLEQFVHSRRKDKQITQELTEQLCKTFVTPLEREDIQALAAALYKIPKTVEKIGERVLICPSDMHGVSFRKHLDLLDQAAECVLAMVKDLRKGIDAPRAREKNNRLQTIEGTVPRTTALPPGCHFEPRCPYRMPRCKEGEIPLYLVGETVMVRCVLFDPATVHETETINHRGHRGNHVE